MAIGGIYIVISIGLLAASFGAGWWACRYLNRKAIHDAAYREPKWLANGHPKITRRN